MSTRIPINHSHRPILCCLAWLLTCVAANALSIVFPKFSAPVFQNDRLIVTSPDSKRLLCVSLTGKKLWEQKYTRSVRLFVGSESEPLLQNGNVISDISPISGELKPRFAIEDAGDWVGYSPIVGSFVANDRHSAMGAFKLFDRQTGKLLWRSQEVEELICATPDVFVALVVERVPEKKGFKFGKASLDAFDRRTFVRKWSVPLAESSWVPFLPTAFKSPYLIYVDGQKSLVVLDCTTGRKHLTKEIRLPQHDQIGVISKVGDQVVWLSERMNFDDFANSENTLHFCSIPELVEQKTVTIKVLEIASISFEGEFIVSDALYRTACFRLNGQKVWERFQTERTPIIGNRIYFSDNEHEKARLGYVEVSTGKAKLLYQERIKQQNDDRGQR